MTPERLEAFLALSSAASRYANAREAAAGSEPGSPARVRAAELHTSLVDRRAAHTLACGAAPDEVSPIGILTVEATLARRAPAACVFDAEHGHCLTHRSTLCEKAPLT